eukprot:3791645-Amphidinium_carterae.2
MWEAFNRARWVKLVPKNKTAVTFLWFCYGFRKFPSEQNDDTKPHKVSVGKSVGSNSYQSDTPQQPGLSKFELSVFSSHLPDYFWLIGEEGTSPSCCKSFQNFLWPSVSMIFTSPLRVWLVLVLIK